MALNQELMRGGCIMSALYCSGCTRSRQVTQATGLDEGDEDDAECVICHAYVRESAVECDCCPR